MNSMRGAMAKMMALSPDKWSHRMNTNLDRIKATLTVPPLQPRIETPAPTTARDPATAVARLRDLDVGQRGWVARVQARRAELEELVPESMEDVLDMDDEKLAQVAALQVQVSIGESALSKIRADERPLIVAAVAHIGKLGEELKRLADERLANVEAAARKHLREVIPVSVFERVLSLLPAVRAARSIHQATSNQAGLGISMIAQCEPGRDSIAVPHPHVSGSLIIHRVDAMEAAIAEARARLSAPIDVMEETPS